MLSPGMRLLVRKVYYFPYDLCLIISGKKNNMEPAKGDIYIGSGDFKKQGQHQLHLLKNLVDLDKNDTVLDIGSGIGRTAVALTGYLNSDGIYEGFDVVEKGINWCNSKIKSKYPNFNFRYIPLNNDLYNKAEGKADIFKFPYDANIFDVVFLFSVFTHMRPGEVSNYLLEICRVLKCGGKCLATFFIYNEKEEIYISKNNKFCFPYKEQGFRLMNKNVRCANIAFEADNIFTTIENSGLEISKIVNGYWKNQDNKNKNADFQDIIIMTKNK